MSSYFAQGDYFVLGRRRIRRWPAVILAAALLGALVLVPTIAHAGGKGGSSTLRLVRLSQGLAPSSADAAFGEQVTFEVSTNRTDRPWVLNECFKDGTRVLAEIHGFFSGYLFGQTYTLGPTDMWTGGSADCTATLIDYSRGKDGQILTAIRYSVSG